MRGGGGRKPPGRCGVPAFARCAVGVTQGFWGWQSIRAAANSRASPVQRCLSRRLLAAFMSCFLELLDIDTKTIPLSSSRSNYRTLTVAALVPPPRPRPALPPPAPRRVEQPWPADLSPVYPPYPPMAQRMMEMADLAVA